MLINLQFPLSDIRAFQEHDVGTLAVPKWPLPDPGAFLRGLGPIKFRRRGGMANWILEESVCEVTSIRLTESAVPFKLLYCRLFHDGLCVTKMDIGLLCTAPIFGYAVDERFVAAVFEALHHCRLRHKVTKQQFPLLRLGQFLARQYVFATTTLRDRRDMREADNLVDSGSPTLFIENSIDLPPEDTFLESYQEISPAILVRFFADHPGPVWSVVRNRTSDNTIARRLRIVLPRIQTEVYCLRSVLSRIERGDITLSFDPAYSTIARQKLHQYLLEAKHRISFKKELHGELEIGLAEAARAYGRWRPAYIASMLQNLARLNLRRNIYLDTVKALEVLDFEAIREFEDRGSTNILVFAKEVVMKKKYEGQFGIINEGGTVKTGDVVLTSTPSQIINFDIGSIKSDLKNVIEAARGIAATADDYAQLSTLVKAKEAADGGDRSAVIAALRYSGKWTLDLAQKVGASVLTEILKKHLAI
jgi:hypothetical protein